MFTKKHVLLLAGLMLVIGFLAATPGAFAHDGSDCHIPGTHTIAEGDPLCVEFGLIRTTHGRVVEFIQGTTYSVSIVDAGGNAIVSGDSGAWGPIERVDASDSEDLEDCPMPTGALSYWQYSPDNVTLDPGTYFVQLTVTVERQGTGSLHMCGEPPAGPPSIQEPGTFGPLTFWVVTVE